MTGDVRAAAVGAEQAELFAERVRPERLAGFAVDALQEAADAHRVDLAGRRIADDGAPGHAFGGDVGQGRR